MARRVALQVLGTLDALTTDGQANKLRVIMQVQQLVLAESCELRGERKKTDNSIIDRVCASIKSASLSLERLIAIQASQNLSLARRPTEAPPSVGFLGSLVVVVVIYLCGFAWLAQKVKLRSGRNLNQRDIIVEHNDDCACRTRAQKSRRTMRSKNEVELGEA